MTVKTAAPVDQLRKPTTDQVLAIYDFLTEVYDTDAKRYRNGETDKTISECVEGGCMPGWVAEVREKRFGPNGGNEAMIATQIEVKDLGEVVAAQILKLESLQSRVNQELKDWRGLSHRVTEAEKKIGVAIASVGPKARLK